MKGCESMRKKWLVKLVGGIVSICIGVGTALILNRNIFTDESRNIRVKADVKVKEEFNLEKEKSKTSNEALIKELKYDGCIYYNDIKYDKDVYIKTYLFEITPNMKVNENNDLFLEGIDLGWTMKIDNKDYGVLYAIPTKITINEKDQIMDSKGKKVLETLDIYLIESKINDNGKIELVNKEEKTYKEFIEEKENKEYKKFFINDLEKYKADSKESLKDETELKLLTEEIKNKYKMKKISYENFEEVYGSNYRYYVGYFLDEKNYENNVYAIRDRKEDKTYTFQKETSPSIREIFQYKDKLYALRREGDILEIELKEDKIEIINTFKNKVKHESVGECHLLGLKDGYVYFRNYKPVDSIMAFDLEKEEFKLVYNSKFEVMEDIDMFNGYIAFYKDPKNSGAKSIGVLKEDKIEILIDNIEDMKYSTELFNEDTVIIENRKEDKQTKKLFTEIKVYKLN